MPLYRRQEELDFELVDLEPTPAPTRVLMADPRDFDVVYAYPWGGEEAMMLDLMRAHGGEDARLVLHSTDSGVRVYHRGQIE